MLGSFPTFEYMDVLILTQHKISIYNMVHYKNIILDNLFPPNHIFQLKKPYIGYNNITLLVFHNM